MRMSTSYRILQLAIQCLAVASFAPLNMAPFQRISKVSTSTSVSSESASGEGDYERLLTLSENLNQAMMNCQPEFIKTCKVKVAPTNNQRLGLIATDSIRKGDVALAIPFDEQIILTPDLATKTVFKGTLPEGYDGWTGDNGLLALLVLNELAKASSSSASGAGVDLPIRKSEAASLIKAWIAALPSPSEMATMHPILWDEDDQETLQSSSTKKIYRVLDDIEDDATWLEEKIWSQDRIKFPQSITLGDGQEYPCFSAEGFSWAMAIVSSRAVFVDGSSRIVPVMDMANHNDFGVEEVRRGYMGTFGTTKGVELRTGKSKAYKKGEEVFASYGPKSSAEYLLEHGFIPAPMKSLSTSVAELTFEVEKEDRFYDDKLDILEFETYESAPMEPVQKFDAVSEVGRDGEPDPAMLQFLRLAKLGAMDAFLLESIFRNEVWGFMSEPVSEVNERDALDALSSACAKALSGMEGIKEGIEDFSEDDPTPAVLCAFVRASECKALSRTAEFVKREKEALDLKEYYQERRLKDLGLDSDWSPDESSGDYSEDEELGYGQRRAPGGLDW